MKSEKTIHTQIFKSLRATSEVSCLPSVLPLGRASIQAFGGLGNIISRDKSHSDAHPGLVHGTWADRRTSSQNEVACALMVPRFAPGTVAMDEGS